MFEGMTPPKDGSKCKVGQMAAKLSDEDQQILNEALSDVRWSTLGLTKELNARGFIIGDTALRRHRDKVCTCVK